MECYTPSTMLQHTSRTAEAAEVSISIEAVLATLRACDPEMSPISCTNILYTLSQYYLISTSLSSGPAEDAHVGGGAPFTPSLDYTRSFFNICFPLKYPWVTGSMILWFKGNQQHPPANRIINNRPVCIAPGTCIANPVSPRAPLARRSLKNSSQAL